MAIVHFRPFLTGRQFTLFSDCSALTWLFRSRDLDPQLYRWALLFTEFDMIMKWRPETSHPLPDALARLLRPGGSGDSIDDSFPDDTSPGNATDYAGPSGPILDGQLLNDLEPFKEGMLDLGGVRKKHLVRSKSPTSPRTPSILSVIVDSIPRAVAALDPLPEQCDDLTSSTQLATFPFHDRLATIETDGAVLPVRRSSRARTPSVRLMPLPELDTFHALWNRNPPSGE